MSTWTNTPQARAILARVTPAHFKFELTRNFLYDCRSWWPTSNEGWDIKEALEEARREHFEAAFGIRIDGLTSEANLRRVIDAMNAQHDVSEAIGDAISACLSRSVAA